MSLLPIVLAVLLGQDPQPVPDEAARKQAEKLVRDLFKAEYGKTSPADRAALARTLLQQASQSRSDPASFYVLLAQAEDLAVLAGDVDLALSAVEEAGRAFSIDVPARKEAVLQRAAPRTPEDAKRAAAAWLKLTSEALAAGQFERAEKAAGNAASLARKAKDLQTATRAEALAKESADLKGKYRGLAQARQTLLAQPEDPAANTLVGRFECFVTGNWSSGLPRIAKGNDAALAGIAQEELGAGGDAAKLSVAADGWRATADKEPAVTRLSLLRHAGELYRTAIPGLTGLSKARAEKRLEEIDRLVGAAEEVDIIALIDSKLDSVRGTWNVRGTTLVSQAVDILEIPYVPPDEYDLRLIVERKSGTENLSVGIVVGGRQVAVGMDEMGNQAGLHRIDGLRAWEKNGTQYEGVLLPPNKERSLLISVRKTGVAFTVDGQKIFDWKGESSRLSRNPAVPLRSQEVMYLISNESQFVIKKFVLTPLSGRGKSTR